MLADELLELVPALGLPGRLTHVKDGLRLCLLICRRDPLGIGRRLFGYP